MPYYEQRGENSWRLVVEAPTGPGGSRKRERETITVDDPAILKSPRKLEDFLNKELTKFQILVESGEYIKSDHMFFKDFVEKEWRKKHADVSLGGRTLKNYLSIIRSQLMPEFGHMAISKIKTIHVVNYFTKLYSGDGRKDGKNKPLATNTLLNIHSLLKSIFDCAEDWKFIKSNPMDGAKRPIRGKKEKLEMKKRKKAYTPEEAHQAIVLLGTLPDRWRMYFIGVMMGGFRRGEMLGVEWPDVDYIRGGIHIKKQITFDVEGKKVEDDVKTVESEAFVPMPEFYMHALQQYETTWEEEAENLGLRWKGENKKYLFHSGFGQMLYPDAPTRFWNRLMKNEKFKLPAIRLHDLRHTTAKLLRESGADTKSIQEILRHAREETTSNMYMEESVLTNRRYANELNKYAPVFYADDQINIQHH